AGAPARTETTAPPPSLFRAAWCVPVDGKETTDAKKPVPKVLSPREQSRLLAFHPVIADGQVYLSDGRSVSALDLRNGRRSVCYDLVQENKRSEEHTSELQSPCNLVCRLLLEKKKI